MDNPIDAIRRELDNARGGVEQVEQFLQDGTFKDRFGDTMLSTAAAVAEAGRKLEKLVENFMLEKLGEEGMEEMLS